MQHTGLLAGEKKVLLMSAMDRLGMALSLEKAGCRMVYGDFPFALGIPYPLKSLRTVAFWARLLVPLIRLLPFTLIYPTGEQQEVNKPKFYVL